MISTYRVVSAYIKLLFYSFIFGFLNCQVTFPKVKVRLKLDSVQRNIPKLTQVCFVITTG